MLRDFTLHRPSEDDWAAIRDLRLRAIADTPIAFLETLDEALAVDEHGWRSRARRNLAGDSTQVVAVAQDGRWIGNMICFVSDGPPHYVARREPHGRRANLVGVFVDPAWRGDAGVTDALFAAIFDWVANEMRLERLYLHVSAANEVAMRSYARRGFCATGEVDTVPERPDDRELEMFAAVPKR